MKKICIRIMFFGFILLELKLWLIYNERELNILIIFVFMVILIYWFERFVI